MVFSNQDSNYKPVAIITINSFSAAIRFSSRNRTTGIVILLNFCLRYSKFYLFDLTADCSWFSMIAMKRRVDIENSVS